MDTALADQWSDALLFAAPAADPAPDKIAIVDEVVTPEQFFTPAERSRVAWTPERRLLLAVLEDAVAMFFRYRTDRSTRGKRLFRETQAWFATTNRTALGDFEFICDHLNLDADYIRAGLRRLPEAPAEKAVSLYRLLRRPQSGRHHLTVVPDSNRS
ncbi:MAG: hypothetical protein FJ147_23355 [Deltaproteobacteria bacterium]|nr:hypothetical protein [Deltaproteobacteria bacterium]